MHRGPFKGLCLDYGGMRAWERGGRGECPLSPPTLWRLRSQSQGGLSPPLSRQLLLIQLTSPGQGTGRERLLGLLRSGSAPGHRNARSGPRPPGPAAQRESRGRPGAAATAATAAAAAPDTSAER